MDVGDGVEMVLCVRLLTQFRMGPCPESLGKSACHYITKSMSFFADKKGERHLEKYIGISR